MLIFYSINVKFISYIYICTLIVKYVHFSRYSLIIYAFESHFALSCIQTWRDTGQPIVSVKLPLFCVCVCENIDTSLYFSVCCIVILPKNSCHSFNYVLCSAEESQFWDDTRVSKCFVSFLCDLFLFKDSVKDKGF